jgi:hypothetical protein
VGQKKLDQSQKLTATYFSSALLLNEGNMKFTLKPLPYEAQLSTMRAATVLGNNKNELSGLLLMGNFYANNMEIGRQDADFGTLLQYEGAGKFRSSALKGLTVTGEVRNIRQIRIGIKTAYIIARNNDPVMVIAQK